MFIVAPSGQPQWSPARLVTVVALGSDWADVLTVIGD